MGMVLNFKYKEVVNPDKIKKKTDGSNHIQRW
jgi:hypothetical protein